MIPAAFFCILAVGLEITGVWLVAHHQQQAMSIPYFLAMHFFSCLMFAIATPKVLPFRYRAISFSSSVFLFSVTFCIPLLGILGLLFGLVPALWRQHSTQPPPSWLQSKESPLPIQSATIDQDVHAVGVGNLSGILSYSKDESKRMRALIATLSLDNQHALPLLRIALKDTDDDVRLLAYALMKRKEMVLDRMIDESMSHLKAAAIEDQFSHHKALATHLWELSHLGVGTSAVNLLCERARSHAEAALQIRNTDAELHLLLGRIFLAGQNLVSASDAFHRAVDCGIDQSSIMPYLAEIAFHEQRLSEVGGYLATARVNDRQRTLTELSNYWNEGRHEST